MPNRILDQRYELLELVGGGGMADVYKAKDLLLDRLVAVKILHAQFKTDQEFIERFNREAQAAAKLMHPNIVNIYDVGVSDGDHYIVMEYVPGCTLKELIKKKGNLPVQDAVRIAREIAQALAHAHEHNLVHCDIKPHNILMASSGTAKVADFGIARAVTESTMTYSDSVVGSVHYFSPEQAKGALITPKSDVYSLGVVLYEMLTGQLPFTGDTPVSIAMKHLSEEPAPIHELNPAVPPMVEAVVQRAMSKDPAQRPTAEEMVKQLLQAESMATIQRRPQAEDPDATQMMPRINNSPQDALPFGTEEDHPEKSFFKSKKIIFGLICVLLLGFGVGAFLSFGKFWSSETVEVPDVVGKQMTLAKQILEDKKLRVNVSETYNADVPAGQVISQDPAAGSKVKEERLVTIYVSKGGEEIKMPDLVGLKKEDAEEKIKKMGLKVGKVYEKDSDKEAGTVIQQDPNAGDKVVKGKEVDLIVSKGKKVQKVSVPNVVGMNADRARQALEAKGLHVSISTKAGGGAPNTVISQSANGEVPAGSSVTLVVSSGAEKKPAQQPQNQQPSQQQSSQPAQPRTNSNGETSKQ
jgi:serine/threonine protein kinase